MRNCVLAVLLLLVSVVSIASSASLEKKDLSEYLYLKEKPSDVYPIQEYKTEDKKSMPDFLFSVDYPYPRIVEFYAHWCPHCQHFKPKYIELGRKLRSVTQEMHLTAIETHAVSCVPNQNLCRKLGIKGYPSVKLFPAHSVNGTVVNISVLHPLQIFRQLGISTDQYSDKQNASVATAQQPANSHHQAIPPHFSDRSKNEIFDDAHLSFDFAMKTAIYTTAVRLPTKARTALKNMLRILQKCVPPSGSLQPVLQALLQDFDQKAGKSEELLQEIVNDYPPPTKTWSPSCLQHGTGYTCGLWQLFHIVSVGMVEWNALAPNDDLRLAPLEVADTLRNYIEVFFQCEECRANFLNDYDGCGHDRCNRLVDRKVGTTETEWREFPLWLYETHNGVNTRLRKERIEADEHEPATEYQVMWPPKSKCPSCWLSDGRWDEDQVYRFLRLEYWPEDYKAQLFRNQLNANNNHNHIEDDIHPSLMAHVERRRQTSGLEEEPSPLGVSPSTPLALLIALLMSAAGMVWQRKRQFDRKGYHKKRESDLSACA